jgi:hypothetical protein
MVTDLRVDFKDAKDMRTYSDEWYDEVNEKYHKNDYFVFPSTVSIQQYERRKGEDYHIVGEPISIGRKALEKLNIAVRKAKLPKKQQISIQEVIDSLSDYETRVFNDSKKYPNQTDEYILEVMVNTVEGDTSQLSPLLEKYARQKGWLDAWEAEEQTPTRRRI